MLSAAASLATSVDEAELLTHLCRNAVLAGHNRFAWYGRLARDGTFEVRPVAWAGDSRMYLDDLYVTWDDSETGRGPDGTAARTGRVATVHDTRAVATSDKEPDFGPWKVRADAFGFRSKTAIPVFVRGQVDGILAVYSEQPGVFDDLADSIHLALCQQAGVGLERLQAARRMTEALEDTIKVLSATIDARDPYTAGHQASVAAISEKIAIKMGLPGFEVQGVSVAALVHDIGKVAVPIELLLKPSELRPEERALVQTHTTRGQEVLAGINFPWPIAQIVGQHHERLNGSGYPNALTADDILPATKIVMVADVFDAMCAERPYRRRLPVQTTMSYLTDRSGRAFDADVVEALRAIKPESLIAG